MKKKRFKRIKNVLAFSSSCKQLQEEAYLFVKIKNLFAFREFLLDTDSFRIMFFLLL